MFVHYSTKARNKKISFTVQVYGIKDAVSRDACRKSRLGVQSLNDKKKVSIEISTVWRASQRLHPSLVNSGPGLKNVFPWCVISKPIITHRHETNCFCQVSKLTWLPWGCFASGKPLLEWAFWSCKSLVSHFSFISYQWPTNDLIRIPSMSHVYRNRFIYNGYTQDS